MNDNSKRWLIAAQAFQSFLMGVMVFGFFGMRMVAGSLFGRYFEGKRLPEIPHWILNWGPADVVSALACALFCAATYLSLSLIAIARADTPVQVLSAVARRSRDTALRRQGSRESEAKPCPIQHTIPALGTMLPSTGWTVAVPTW